MKHAHPSRRPAVFRTGVKILLQVVLAAGAVCGAGPSALAVDRYWANTGTDFNATTSWLNGAPGVADRAIFSTALQYPTATASASISGVTFFQPGTLLSATTPTNIITLGSTASNDLSTALYAAAPGLSAVTANLELGASGATGNAFIGAILGAELVVTGDISGARLLNKTGFGTVTLAGNNTFTGGVSHTGANGNFGVTRLNLNSNTALGTGAFSIGTGNGGVTIGNTSGSAHTLPNALTLGANSGVTTTWDLPANGSGNLTFMGEAKLNNAATNVGHSFNIFGGSLTLRGELVENVASANFAKTGSGTLVFGNAVKNTGTANFAGGGVTLDMSTGGSFQNTLLPLTLVNTNFSVVGATTGASSQTLTAGQVTSRAGIAVNGNGGAGTTLTLTGSITRAASATLAVDLQGNATLAATIATSAGQLAVGVTAPAAFATVTDSGGTGFATVNGGNIVRYASATTLTTSSSDATTNYITKVGDGEYLGNTLQLAGVNHTYNSLQLDTSGGAGVLDLNGTNLALTDRGLLVTGNNNFTIQSGSLGGAVELVVHQFSTGTLTINSPIGGLANNSATLTKTGPGTLTLGGTQLFNVATVTQGTVNVLGTLRQGVTVTGSTVATGGTLNLQNAGALTAGTLTATGTGIVNQTVPNAISGAAIVNLATVGSIVQNPTVNLSMANNYTGNTTISTGRLNLGDSGAIGTGTFIIAGGVVDNSSGAPMTLAANNPITISAGFIFAGSSSLNLGTGAVGLGTANRNILVLANTLTLGGIVGGAGGGITKIGNGTLVLNGDNNYTGATNVQGGVLLLNHANALPGGIGATGGTANLNLVGGMLGLGAGDFTRELGTGVTQVQLTGTTGFAAFGGNRIVNLGGAAVPVTWNTSSFVTSSAGNAAFLLSAPSANGSVDFQNPIILGATGTNTRTVWVENGSASVDAKLSGGVSSSGGTQSFTKVGPGTLELSGANNYNGTTQILDGTFLVTGSVTGTSAVNVAGGAVLGGTGDLQTSNGGFVTLVKGAALSPGAGNVGTFNIFVGSGQLDISGAAEGTGAFRFELGTASDLALLSGGTLNIGSGELNFADFAFTAGAGFTSGTYMMFDTFSPISGFLGGDLTGTIAGLSATLGTSLDGQDVILTVVPEPGSAALLLGGLAMVAGRRRRK